MPVRLLSPSKNCKSLESSLLMGDLRWSENHKSLRFKRSAAGIVIARRCLRDCPNPKTFFDRVVLFPCIQARASGVIAFVQQHSTKRGNAVATVMNTHTSELIDKVVTARRSRRAALKNIGLGALGL